MTSNPTNSPSAPTVFPSSEKSPVVQTNDNSNPQQGSGHGIMSNAEQTSITGGEDAGVGAAGRLGLTNTMKNPPTKRDSRKLFVGGLPADVVESEFREFFEQFGQVVDSVVMFDRETHRSRGFGFVTFQDAEVADRLLSMGVETDSEGKPTGTTTRFTKGQGPRRVGRLVMRGKTCEVKAAEPKESAKGNRRVYQNQVGGRGPNNNNSAGGRFTGPDPRFYATEEGQAGGPIPGGFPFPPHPHHAMSGHYPMPPVPGGYYLGTHHYMGHPGMYAPMVPIPPTQGDAAHPHPHHPASFPPIIATHMEAGAYMEGSIEGVAHTTPDLYYHPHQHQDHVPTQFPSQLQNYPMYSANNNNNNNNSINNSNPGNSTFGAPGGSSVMQPAAPGLPPKEESP